MKKHLSTILLVLVFLVGCALLLYPTVSDWWNSKVQSRAVADYTSAVQNMTGKDTEAVFAAADEYNAALRELNFPLSDYAQLSDAYNSTLDITGTGIMGYITIDKIKVELPIYHGTSDASLAAASGHLEGSSLPVGGEGTHAVISAHRGLPSARLFTDLDKLEVGDTFTVTVLDRVLTYQVDQIKIVDPNVVDDLTIVDGQDYCTLLTCTPYGINTQRLLVRGTRVDTPVEKNIYIASEAYRLDSLMLAPLVAAPMLLVLLVVLLVKYRKPRSAEPDDGERDLRW